MPSYFGDFINFGLPLFLLSCQSNNEPNKKLIMGFVPLSESESLIDDLGPLEKALTEKMGLEVKAFVASNYVGVVSGLSSNKIDFAFVPPFAYVLAKQSENVKALLLTKNKKGVSSYTSSIYVRKDSTIKKLSDLKNKKIAFVDYSSSSGYIFPSAFLLENGLKAGQDYQPVLTGGHDKSLQALVDGDVDACAVFSEAPSRYAKHFPKLQESVIELSKTKPIPGVSIVASEKLNKEQQEKLKNALLEIAENQEYKDLLAKLFGIYGFKKAEKLIFFP